MPKPDRLSGKETIRRLGKLGFHQVRQRGSHAPINEVEVAETIRNLGMLKWFHLIPSTDMPVQDELVQ